MRFISKLGVASTLFMLAWSVVSTAAEMRGVTATEIRIGQTMPYSGAGVRVRGAGAFRRIADGELISGAIPALRIAWSLAGRRGHG